MALKSTGCWKAYFCAEKMENVILQLRPRALGLSTYIHTLGDGDTK